MYRFSVSWSRVLPTGHIDNINEKGAYQAAFGPQTYAKWFPGLAYYRDLIRKLKQNNIEPFINMHHADNPRPIEDEGGFLNAVRGKFSVFWRTLHVSAEGKEGFIWIFRLNGILVR